MREGRQNAVILNNWTYIQYIHQQALKQTHPQPDPTMCSHYEACGADEPSRKVFIDTFKAEPPTDTVKKDVWPGYASVFVRKHPLADVGDEAVPAREALAGRFGLVPHWAKDLKGGRSTFNARSETVAEKPSFRDAWKNGQFCIIPAQAFYEPDWRSGKAVAARIQRADGKPMAIAGIWARWSGSIDQEGDVQEVLSFCMLTVNADQHAFMRNFHKAEDEKRMVVILPEDSQEAWLNAKAQDAKDFMRMYRENGLVVA